MSEGLAKLTSGSLLARNTVVNVLGLSAPMVVALIAFPFVIAGLGTERFGVLSLAWIVIGYFSVFDLGLTRALTQRVAERLGAGLEEETGPLIWTGLTVVFLFGIAGAVLLAVVSPLLVQRVFTVSEGLQQEVLTTFWILAAALPFVISTSALGGLLEAKQRFGTVNAIRIPMGLLSYVGPLLVFPFSNSLVPVVLMLAIGRVVAWIAHIIFCFRAYPSLRNSRRRIERSALGPLLRFGGWMTVTNVLSPLMVYMDRFLIGAVLSMSAVAYYVTPYEIITKLRLLPAAVAGVLFPAFAASYITDLRRTNLLFSRGQKTIYFAMFPISLAIVVFAPYGLRLWLGEEFATGSSRVLQWLAIGLFINSVAQLPFTVVQGAGRPDLTAKLHLLELPLYVGLVLWLTYRFGIAGTAAAWVIRVAIDTGALLVLSGRILPGSRRVVIGTAVAALAGVGVLLLAAELNAGLWKQGFLVAIVLLFALLGWRRVLSDQERELVNGFRNRRRGDAASVSAVARVP